jgi:superfamily II DNA/RNA helicase
VVDEADRMADMGFLPDVKRILDQTRDDRQILLFSATLDGAVDQLVTRYQRDPVVHELHEDPAGEITHHFWLSERPGRVALVAEIIERLGHTVVFCRTKHGSDRVARQLTNTGVKAVAIHGNRSQAQRERALEAFHRGDVGALVATDVAARGIHVEGVLGVVHFDVPADPKDYIHRSGRTGRAGMAGTVVTLVDAKSRKDAVKLKKALGIDVEITEPDVAALPEGPQQALRPRGRARRSGEVAPGGSARPPKQRASAPAARQGGARTKAGPATGAKSSSENRAERRQRQFSDEERARRAAANQAARVARAARADKGARADVGAATTTPSRTSGASSRARASDDRVLPADTPGAAKVRPSGASRRKARRERLAAEGQPVPPSKKRRSGKPRPPASAAKRRAR